MASFVKCDGKELFAARPNIEVPEVPVRMGSLFGRLEEVTLDYDHIGHRTRLVVKIELTEASLVDQGGIGWLQAGRNVWISQ